MKANYRFIYLSILLSPAIWLLGAPVPAQSAILSFPAQLLLANASAGYNRITTIDDSASNVVGLYTSIAIGIDGFPIISYYDDTARSLKVAHCTDAACQSPATITTVDDDFSMIEGRYSAIAIGDDGFPVISYQGDTGASLRVAKCVDIACAASATRTDVDTTTAICCTFTSIAIGNNGRPVISYLNDGLRVARCANPECTGTASVTTVDSSSFLIGYFSSIAIGNDGLPIVSYHDLSNDKLKVVKCDNSACTNIASITELESGGEYSSLAIRNDGTPIISHHDGDTLRFDVCGDTSCTSATPTAVFDPPGESVGLYSDLAIRGGGRPIISHFNESAGSLMVTACESQDCGKGTVYSYTVDSPAPGAAAVGEHSSIAIGNDNLPVVSYFDGQTGALKVVQCASRSCDGLFRDDYE